MVPRRFNKKPEEKGATPKEMKQAQASGKPQVWRTKQTADRKQPSANIQMTFLLPSEFRVNGESQQLIQAVGFKNLS